MAEPRSALEILRAAAALAPGDAGGALSLIQEAWPKAWGLERLAFVQAGPPPRILAAAPLSFANASFETDLGAWLARSAEGDACVITGSYGAAIAFALREPGRLLGALIASPVAPYHFPSAALEAPLALASLLLGRSIDRLELHERNDQVREVHALSELGRRVTSVAHEFGGPLQAITALAEVLLREQDRAGREDAARRILRSALRCRSIAQDLLSVSRAPRAAIRPVPITDALMDALELDRFSDVGEISIEMPEADRLPDVLCDPRRLTQVLSNLLTNARHAIAEAGRPGLVRVHAHTVSHPMGPRVRIAIEDDGPGIAEELRGRLFQAYATQRAPGEGTGLGLWISRRLIEEMGGTLELVSEPKARGATFAIELPAAAKTSHPAPAPIDQDTLPPLRVLVVDDDREILETYEVLLSLSGHAVVGVDRAQKALQRLEQDRFDAVVCDARLPDLSGLEFKARLDAARHPAKDRLIFATGDVLNEDLREVFDTLDSPVLFKPFRAEDLEAALAKILRLHGRA